LKIYPAVVNESRFTQAKAVVYINTALIFAGSVMIRIQSASQNRDLAQKTLNEFVDIMKIEEGPPLQPVGARARQPRARDIGQGRAALILQRRFAVRPCGSFLADVLLRNCEKPRCIGAAGGCGRADSSILKG
jgi:hypothetical protein